MIDPLEGLLTGPTPLFDLRNRMKPSDFQTTTAVALIAATGAHFVTVPLAMPGKIEGVWETGQVVEHPNGFWPVLDRGRSGLHCSARARDAAESAAVAHLDPRPGTTAYANIYSQDEFAVFESI